MYTTVTVKVYCTDTKNDVKTKLNNKKMNIKGPILKTIKTIYSIIRLPYLILLRSNTMIR